MSRLSCRFANSDFAISHILQAMAGICEVVISYDIACQYVRNFEARFNRMPTILLLPLQLFIIFLIPKFHLPVHKEECRYKYSFNYMKKVGRTDGEAIERFWSSQNHLSGSTMRMTPGARLDTLNFHFNDWNWRKTCKMGWFVTKSLMKLAHSYHR
jgi:Kyakuja-Dileera-Zisupton transposase